jgi:general secretion pathway protein M
VNAFKKWLAEAAPREQLTLGLGALALVIYILFVGVLDPLHARLEQQQQRNEATKEALQRMRSMAARYVNREAGAQQTRSGSIVELVDRSLRRHSIRMSGMQPSGRSDVRLRMDQVNFDALLAWMYDMEVNEGVQIRDLSVAAGPEPGTVVVNVRLHKE